MREESPRETTLFPLCVPLGVTDSAWKLVVPLQQLVLEGDLRAGEDEMPWRLAP
jgi:hypothetical protein